ncbi:MAG: mechanosensitive ion channel protein MscL [Candidatus Saccharibacteria bacterium]|nr:mechanosensitive ion channel protein MscL [Candidatus Saccharibacteria bacterium]
MPDKKTNTKPSDDTTNKVEVKATVKHGKMRGRRVTVLLDADDAVKEQVNGFVNFLREHAIVGLAVGFVAGAQAQAVVKQLISSFIDPSFQLFFGGTKLSERTFTLHLWGNSANFGWGGMVYALLNLVFVLAIIYALIKIFNLDKLDKKKE